MGLHGNTAQFVLRGNTMADTARKCVITCMEPGCQNHITYWTDSDEVPLYCEKHRTEDGRHAAVRVLRKPDPVPEPAPESSVVMRCPKCKVRRTIKSSEWKEAPKGIVCSCGTVMLYHKELP